jgi:dihydrofolate synthase/folylpolyglutamate synthase
VSGDAERQLDELARHYPQRRPRADLSAVERLRDAAPMGHVGRHVVVVGTNGKTSTATYLSRLLTAAGARTGLVTSPHIASWGERLRVDDAPLPVERLAERVGQLASFAGEPEDAPDLRFFDLLTLACESLLADEGVDVAVVEAGLGGRLDASRTLRPPMVVLTGIDLDHTELLGPTREHILAEKLAVAPPGALVLAGGLEGALAERAIAEAERLELRLELVEPSVAPSSAALPPFLMENLHLARHAARRAHKELGLPEPPDTSQIMLDVRGRFERHELDGVPTLVDAAHNPQAFRAVLAAAAATADGRPLVALVALGADRDPDALAEALRGAEGIGAIVATAFHARPARGAGEVAAAMSRAGLQVEVESDPALAWREALQRARRTGGVLVAFGSAYLLGELPLLAEKPAGPSDVVPR